MATMFLAMWLQDTDPGGNRRLILIAIGLMAAAIAAMVVILAVVAVKALKVMKEVSTAAEEVKTKFLPLLDEAMHLSRTGRLLLEDAGPKVKTIGENLVKTTESLMETGRIARGAVEKIDGTLSDANTRAKRQVARVDGMITAALTTTAEVAETISNGIKGPALRIAAMVSQAKGMAEGILSKVKGRAAASGFGQREWPE